jgi:translation initiation factor 4G
MTLYEADLEKFAVEVKSVSRKRAVKPSDPAVENLQKAPRKRKAVEHTAEEPKKRAARKPKAEPKVEEPKVEEPKVEEPKVEEPKVEEPKVEEPKVEIQNEKKPRAPRKKRDPAIAPQWFSKYVEGVQREQAVIKNEKVPAKKAKEEAQEAAAKSWKNGLTRDRVQNEVDGHMSRMYSMIFSK